MVIKEFLPNPIGDDKEGEYIKIFNDSDKSVFLSNWSIKDASGKIYKLNGELTAQKELLLPYAQTKITLNNNGEQLFLYDANGKLTDELGYGGQIQEGEVVFRKETSLPDGQESETGNQNFNIKNQILYSKDIFIGLLVSLILAELILYVILKIEKKLEIKLF